MKKFFTTIIALAGVLLLSSWGGTGHNMISYRITLSFNEEMSFYSDWVFFLTEHASDPDKRKGDDPTEGPKHYIDIDNYPSFIAGGTIPSTLDSCIAEYGEDFVGDNGYLPWATMASYDSLVACLKRDDMPAAKQFAADLGHYVADGHMPFHLTRNYDGQFTGNKGIHGRYESDMIARYSDQISYTGTPAGKIENVSDYIFQYIYENYPNVDSLIIADDYAKEMSNGVYNDAYYAALWEMTARMTTRFFKDASHAFAELLYTAWIEAGKPGSDDQETSSTQASLHRQKKLSIYPNPATLNTTIQHPFPMGTLFSGTIYDASGKITAYLPETRSISEPGFYLLDTGLLANGLYYLVLQTGQYIIAEPLIISN